MGLFTKLKDMFQEKDYITMTQEELFRLDDAELEIAVSDRLYAKRKARRAGKQHITGCDRNAENILCVTQVWYDDW